MKDIIKLFNSTYNQIDVPYIIAEAGVNHEGSIETAKRQIDEAKEGGADAIKFQTYKASTLAAKNSPAYWDLSKEPTTSQYELFSKHDKFWKEEMETLKNHCDRSGIEFMSTPFDIESADFLNDIMRVFKISSSDITNFPFIDYICRFQKPIILSTGASHLHEIQEAVQWIEERGNKLALLHCVLNYPTPNESAALGMIKGLSEKFPQHTIGYSDHTLPKETRILEYATLLGARIIEKHFTHDKQLPGNDHYHAMDLNDLKAFKRELQFLTSVVGKFSVSALEGENSARQNARRSLVSTSKLKKGEKIEEKHLTFKRPASGISPKYIKDVIGKELERDIEEDTILQWNMIS